MSDKWQLIKVQDLEWEQDDSGYYSIVNVVSTPFTESITIRLDILTSDHSPAVSFQGTADAVRKHAMRYAEEHGWNMSLEHAAYIGAELARAELLTDYVQE